MIVSIILIIAIINVIILILYHHQEHHHRHNDIMVMLRCVWSSWCTWGCSPVSGDQLWEPQGFQISNRKNPKIDSMSKVIKCQDRSNSITICFDLILREGLKAKKRVTGLVLAVILSFVGELVHLAIWSRCGWRCWQRQYQWQCWESWDWEKMNLQHVGHWRRRIQNDIPL